MRGDTFNNVWFNYAANAFNPAVVACVNDIVLLDRRLLDGRCQSDLQYDGGPYKWAVYNSTNTRYSGEWTGYKSRKEALAAFNKLARLQLPTTVPRKLDGWAQDAWNAEEKRLERLGVQRHPLSWYRTSLSKE